MASFIHWNGHRPNCPILAVGNTPRQNTYMYKLTGFHNMQFFCVKHTLTKAKLWQRYDNFWAICDLCVALIWDGQMVVWHCFGVSMENIWVGKSRLGIIWENYGDELCLFKFIWLSLDMDFILELHFSFFLKNVINF